MSLGTKRICRALGLLTLADWSGPPSIQADFHLPWPMLGYLPPIYPIWDGFDMPTDRGVLSVQSTMSHISLL